LLHDNVYKGKPLSHGDGTVFVGIYQEQQYVKSHWSVPSEADDAFRALQREKNHCSTRLKTEDQL